MSKHYLRVEAVNIANFVYDTHDISTIRGGSYLLLDAIESVAKEFKGRLTEVTAAASQGLFWFDPASVNPEQVSRQLQKDVLAHLHKKTGGYATFLVATQADILGHFDQVLEKLEAQIHYQQWHLPTIAIPDPEPAVGECFLDGWRPGVHHYTVDPAITDASVSDATAFRRQEGVRLKQQLFFKLLKDEQYLGEISTRDLCELSRNPAKGVLNGKIAYIYVDGNSFGSIRRKLCQSEEDRQAFDQAIQADFRTPFLEALLQWAKANPDFQTRDEQKKLALRLEVLLWGGDEMALVVPAWLSWQVVRLFYQHAASLQFKGQPLSHRAALIFCHHNAPILLVRQLAEELLSRTRSDIRDELKAALENQSLSEAERNTRLALLSDHALGDALHYLVLESFDLLQGKLADFLPNYYKGIDYARLLISAGELDTLLTAIHTIQAHVPHGKALEIIAAIQQKQNATVPLLVKQILELLPAGDRSSVKNAIDSLTGSDVARWYLASDLWDYVPE
jgi:hypothetical protein